MTDPEVRIRPADDSDLPLLAQFTCSTGLPWEDAVQEQIRGPLPRRYLALPPIYDGRLIVAASPLPRILAVGAHRIEPNLLPDVGYIEVVAVSLAARGTLTDAGGGHKVSLGEMLILTMLDQMTRLGRHPRAFARVDRRNTRNLALCQRSGLVDERADSEFPELVQRWGELPY